MCLGGEEQRGLSLVELLVSVAISLLIMVAILQLYLDISRTNDEMAKTNAQIENGRFAIQLFQDEISHAGYWGGYVPLFDDLTSSDTTSGTPALVQRTPRVAPNPCSQDSAMWTVDEKDALLGAPVQAFSQALTGCSMPDRIDGTDVLVVRHAGLSPIATGGLAGQCEDDSDPATPAPACVQNTFCADEMPNYRLGAGTTDTLHFRDCLTATNTTSSDYPQTAVRQLVSNLYYIKSIAGVPTLMRLEFGANAAQPLIEGIEGFKVELGIDDVSKTGEPVDYTVPVDFAGSDENDRSDPINRGDGVPDRFVRCPAAGCPVGELRNVVAVKLYLLVRNLQATPGYSDPKEYCLESPELDAAAACSEDALFQPDAEGRKFKRHLFSSTVRLVNVSGRRETP